MEAEKGTLLKQVVGRHPVGYKQKLRALLSSWSLDKLLYAGLVFGRLDLLFLKMTAVTRLVTKLDIVMSWTLSWRKVGGFSFGCKV